MGSRSEAGSVEYVDVGDKVTLSAADVFAQLARDPVIYPRHQVNLGTSAMVQISNHPN